MALLHVSWDKVFPIFEDSTGLACAVDRTSGCAKFEKLESKSMRAASRLRVMSGNPEGVLRGKVALTAHKENPVVLVVHLGRGTCKGLQTCKGLSKDKIVLPAYSGDIGQPSVSTRWCHVGVSLLEDTLCWVGFQGNQKKPIPRIPLFKRQTHMPISKRAP